MKSQSPVVFRPTIQTSLAQSKRIYPIVTGVLIVITAFSFWEVSIWLVVLFTFLGSMVFLGGLVQTKQTVTVTDDVIEITVPLSTPRKIIVSELSTFGYSLRPWWLYRAGFTYRLMYTYKNGKSAWLLMNLWSPEELEAVVRYVCKKFPTVKKV